MTTTKIPTKTKKSFGEFDQLDRMNHPRLNHLLAKIQVQSNWLLQNFKECSFSFSLTVDQIINKKILLLYEMPGLHFEVES